MGLLVMAMNGRARVLPPLRHPRHHDRRSPPGSPAGLLVTVDEDGPRGIAPPPSSGFAFFKSTSSIGPSTHPETALSPNSPVRNGPRPGTQSGMDAVTLLKNDHKTVEGLFKKFE